MSFGFVPSTFVFRRFFQRSLDDFEVVIMDAHPVSPLDEIWFKLFNAKRLSQLEADAKNGIVEMDSVVWPFVRDVGPLLVRGKKAPLIKEFRKVILDGFNVNSEHTKYVFEGKQIRSLS